MTKPKSTSMPPGVGLRAIEATPKLPPAQPDGHDGRARAVIDAVLPALDNGRFAIKRLAGRKVTITAHCFADGHDVLQVLLRWRGLSPAAVQQTVHEVAMRPLGNDVWQAEFTPPIPGRYGYSVIAWVDPFESWRHELVRRVDADDIRIAAQTGAIDIAAAAKRAQGADRKALTSWATALKRSALAAGQPSEVSKASKVSKASHRANALDPVAIAALKALALDDALAMVMSRYPDRRWEVCSPVELPLTAERERAAFSSWYELFPRSSASEPGVHGSFKDVEARLPAIARMGFDVLYFPPIHPIGRSNRKGRNNALLSEPGDVGSPWAIGAEEGGHKSILPALGTAEEFRQLMAAAHTHGLEIAMDIAFQCAPDHPYVKAHPEWFRWRPDGSVQYAENPPKKYQDIYPFNFESDDWRALWAELKSVFDHWIGEGVKIFRVDNPHTKAFAFWEWVITEVQRLNPDVIFLAEAFTRPKVMHRLAKLGFSQSYTYFTWRNSKQALTAYFSELSQGPGVDYFRPNAWPNTPDILHSELQTGEPAVYMARLVLAATLSANYGIYGPAYELIEHQPRAPASEEYLNSEKYQLRGWSYNASNSLADFIARVNQIRRDHVALQSNESLRFLTVDNDQLMAYVKAAPRQADADRINRSDGSYNSASSAGANDATAGDVIITIVNLDPRHVQSGWVDLDPASIGVAEGQVFQVHDLLSNLRFMWQGSRHYVRLDPNVVPAHVFAVRRRLRSEHDFEYFL